jgi:NAD(P)-dependent dehydrogenase (short-subunit alcohol dehydrogenase family)
MADAGPAVLITGATSGLGRYLARELAGSGWRVLAHGRDPVRVADLSADLGGGARGYVADLASLGEVRDLAGRVRAEVPRGSASARRARGGRSARTATNCGSPSTISHRCCSPGCSCRC